MSTPVYFRKLAPKLTPGTAEGLSRFKIFMEGLTKKTAHPDLVGNFKFMSNRFSKLLLKLSQVQAVLSKFDLAHNDIRMNAKVLCSPGSWAHLIVTCSCYGASLLLVIGDRMVLAHYESL